MTMNTFGIDSQGLYKEVRNAFLSTRKILPFELFLRTKWPRLRALVAFLGNTFPKLLTAPIRVEHREYIPAIGAFMNDFTCFLHYSITNT